MNDLFGTHKPMTDDHMMYCDVCKLALNKYTERNTGEVIYTHTRHTGGLVTTPHDPVPVPVAQMTGAIQKCDFCSELNPGWAYICDNQAKRNNTITHKKVSVAEHRNRGYAAKKELVTAKGKVTEFWGERWAACEGCAALIEARDLLGLVGRAADSLPAKVTRGKRLVQVRGELLDTYGHLLQTLKPGRGAITPDNPLPVWEDQ